MLLPALFINPMFRCCLAGSPPPLAASPSSCAPRRRTACSCSTAGTSARCYHYHHWLLRINTCAGILSGHDIFLSAYWLGWAGLVGCRFCNLHSITMEILMWFSGKYNWDITSLFDRLAIGGFLTSPLLNIMQMFLTRFPGTLALKWEII